jgi:uncharacterized protein (TIGR03118 family)
MNDRMGAKHVKWVGLIGLCGFIFFPTLNCGSRMPEDGGAGVLTRSNVRSDSRPGSHASTDSPEPQPQAQTEAPQTVVEEEGQPPTSSGVDFHPGGNAYVRTNLVTDGALPGLQKDTHLKNPWGIAFAPGGVAWVADNGAGVSTQYDGAGIVQSLIVGIPLPPGGTAPSHPTGIAFNGTPGFVISDGTNSGPARFVFVTEEGIIAGWNPMVPPTGPATRAFIAVDRSDIGAVYKGAAIASDGSGVRLYATDFHNARVDVFDSGFHAVTPVGGFEDPAIPAGFAPFNIAHIAGDLYVTYAKQDAAGEDEVTGPGLGYVNVFDVDGFLLRRLIAGGRLNAPWGLALAPRHFGRFSQRLLVGNFGDGTINAYNDRNGNFSGTLDRLNGELIVIDGLWGLAFGNGAHNQPINTLFFAAGPLDEQHGIYGKIEARVGNDKGR